jgi:murein DD-endopeptidase MepM/ murein hydrolase activator NlpD
VSSVWQDINALSTVQSAVNDYVRLLAAKKQTLTNTKTAAEQKRAQLLKQQQTLAAQQGSLNATKKAQSDLLAQTKNQEATYQTIIAQKKSQETSLEAALADLKSQYNVAVSPNQITAAGKGILHWPLDSVRITQYFGNTPFAQTGAYNGKGHNGIDLAAPIGTPVKAALSGTVIGTGNTDLVRGCYSFGKWVMVKHANGLNTMYAHFSQISVVQGESVSTGEVLGYSGETGYATGPHLHFGVYVSSATQILTLGQATNAKTPCANAVMPVTPLAGYLNPLNYLP